MDRSATLSSSFGIFLVLIALLLRRVAVAFWFQRFANARAFGGRRNAILRSPDARADLAVQRIAEGGEYFANFLDGQ